MQPSTDCKKEETKEEEVLENLQAFMQQQTPHNNARMSLVLWMVLCGVCCCMILFEM
jgi:hypothetical protein